MGTRLRGGVDVGQMEVNSDRWMTGLGWKQIFLGYRWRITFAINSISSHAYPTRARPHYEA